MPTICSYFNPCSDKHHALQGFKPLSCLQKTAIIITCLVCAIICVPFVMPVFRLLVERCPVQIQLSATDKQVGTAVNKSTPSARPRNFLPLRPRQSPGVETIEKGGSIKCNTTPLFDGSTAGAFTRPQGQKISWSGTSTSPAETQQSNVVSIAETAAQNSVLQDEDLFIFIFSFLNDDRDPVSAKGVCKDWLNSIQSTTFVAQTISQNVEQLRSHLMPIRMSCCEGTKGGFLVQLSIDREGRFFTLDGHDARMLQLREDLPTKKYSLNLLMRACDWPSDSDKAFSFWEHDPWEYYPVDPEWQKIAQQILDCLNARARQARSTSEKMGLKKGWSQPWFTVMTNAACLPWVCKLDRTS